MITLAASYFPDTPDRVKNYDRFMEYWSKYPVTIDVEICDQFEPLMVVYNRLAKRCTTQYIAFIDIDVYFDYDNLLKSIDYLSDYDFINPFNKIYNVKDGVPLLQDKSSLHGELNGNISFSRDVSTTGTSSFGAPEKKNHSWNLDINWNTPFFVGLCVITKLSTYFDFGMGNENFKVWGGADDEWYARATKLGYKWTNLDGSIIHHHHEKTNIKHKRLMRNNIIELYKSIAFSEEELKDYISTWHWLKRL